jgi:hypothetical protein
MATFKKRYKKQGKKWITTAEEQELADDLELGEHHGPSHNGVHSPTFRLPGVLRMRKDKLSYESVRSMIRDTLDGHGGDVPVMEEMGNFPGSMEDRMRSFARPSVQAHSFPLLPRAAAIARCTARST